MNKKKNELHVFILLLSALHCHSQLFSASRSILSNMPKEDSTTPNFFGDTKKSESAPDDSDDKITLMPPKFQTPKELSEPEQDFSSLKKESFTPIEKDPFNKKATIQPTTPAQIETKTIGSVSIPQMPAPPINERNLERKNKPKPEEPEAPKEEKKLNEEKKNKKELEIKPVEKKDKPKPEEPKKEAPKKTLTTTEEKKLHEELVQKEKDQQLVRFYFEDATLENLVRYIEELYDVKFFTDDDLNPVPSSGALLKGHKITFTTNKPLTRKEAWDLFLKFLDIAGLTVVPGEGDSNKTEKMNPNNPHKTTTFYRITTLTGANKDVLPTFFDTKLEMIPDNSTKVRYVFFVKNTPLGTIQQVVQAFSSSTAGPILSFPDLNALILTDKGSNIRSLMKIVQEFDKEMPEAMSVLKLKKADAEEVAKLYQTLTQAETPQGAARFMTQRNQPKSLYFPANAKIIPEARTNSLILLGPKAALTKIEEFITKHVDVELDMPYSPLHIYELQHTQASNIAQILNSTATQFGAGTTAGQYGGVRDGNQYFGPMTITPDSIGNRLIIKAEENDYLKLVEIIKKLDITQPQTIIEVLIVDVQTSDDKALGTQIRNKAEDSFIKNVDFQRTGLPTSVSSFSSVVNASNGSLLGNLISLASGASSGSTLLSVGTNQTGVWGILNILQQTSKTDIISNPFLLATNNYQASVTLGSTRNIQTSTVTSTSSGTQIGYSQDNANLTVTITPQISSDGSIQMTISIQISDYSDTNSTSGNKINKVINTAALVQNREVLVLGGIVKNKITQIVKKTPLLGDVPILGWLFKSKSKSVTKSNLLVFISPQIIYPGMETASTEYMKHKAGITTDLSIHSGGHDSTGKDPVNNLLFGTSGHDETVHHITNFMNQTTTPQEKDGKKKKIAKITRKSSKKRKRFRG